MNLEEILIKNLKQAFLEEEVEINFQNNIEDDFNIIDNLDSMGIVNMIIEIESTLEEETGRSISLANEDMFDATKTPLKSWARWVEYIKNIIK